MKTTLAAGSFMKGFFKDWGLVERVFSSIAVPRRSTPAFFAHQELEPLGRRPRSYPPGQSPASLC